MIFSRNFLYTGGLGGLLLAALALWLVELAILAIVRRHLPPLHSVFLSRRTLLLIALAAFMTLMFGRVRKSAAWLQLPYLAWLVFAAALNLAVALLN